MWPDHVEHGDKNAHKLLVGYLKEREQWQELDVDEAVI